MANVGAGLTRRAQSRTILAFADRTRVLNEKCSARRTELQRAAVDRAAIVSETPSTAIGLYRA